VIVRYEPWGAWVRLETTAALVAVDRVGARALGLEGGRTWSEPAPPAAARATRPIEVHVAVTSRCGVGCEGCYLDARPDGVEPPREEMEATFDALARAGVFTVAFGGGEPTLRDDIAELAAAARARGLVPVLTTSGIGLGDRKVERLRGFAQVNVSYDGVADAYLAVRGVDGSAAAEGAIAKLAAAGIDVGVNVVLTRRTYECVEETVRRALDLGAREVQLLRYKPQGRAKTLDYLDKRLTPAQARDLGPLLRRLAREHAERAHVRIDCALVPFLSADAEIAARPEELARWGVFGCEAGALLGAVRVDGRVAPCSFAGPSDLDVSAFVAGWARDATLAAFRAYAEAPPEPCASCTLRAVCKGGCKVVSTHAGRGMAPDPECPRVQALEGTS